MSFVELTEGPLWYIAAAVFVVGVVWHFVGILLLGRPAERSSPRSSSLAGAFKAIALHSIPHGGDLPRTIYHFVVGYAFHLGLFVVLYFAAPMLPSFITGSSACRGSRCRAGASSLRPKRHLQG